MYDLNILPRREVKLFLEILWFLLTYCERKSPKARGSIKMMAQRKERQSWLLKNSLSRITYICQVKIFEN